MPGVRQPLSDIFAPNVPAPASAQKTAFFDKVAQFQISEDAENQPPQHRPASRGQSPQRVGKKINWDSGYHGMTEDEMETDGKTETATQSSQQSAVQKVPLRENQPPPQRVNIGAVDGGTSSDESFTSAREEFTARVIANEDLQAGPEDTATAKDDAMEVDQDAGATEEPEPMDQDQDLDDDQSRTQSDLSSPEKPLQRKSSFTFTALPPRDPLTANKSFGARNSQAERNSTLGKSLGGKSFGITPTDDDDDDYVENKSEESKAHNKTSTQLMHEKINMLAKTKDPRTSKSLHQSVLGSQAAYPQLPAAEPSNNWTAVDEDSDDDWIAPTKPAQQSSVKPVQPTPERPAMHQKSMSTTQIPSPVKPELAAESTHKKAISVSNPNLAYEEKIGPSTTPAGSPPSKKSHDGPLSASKNKLYSMLKSAKSVFASSASASAAAKLEAHNNSPSRSPRRDLSDESKTAAVFNMPGALYSERQLPQSPSRPVSVKSFVSSSPSKKSRASNESDKKREKELKAQQKAADDLEKAREKERQKAVKHQEEKAKAEQAEAAKREKEAQKMQAQSERPTTAGSDKSKDSEMPPPTAKGMFATGKLRAPGRLVKPTAQSSKPAPVSIRVASQSQRLHQAPSTSSLSKSQHEPAGPPVPPKPQTTTRPGSAQGRPGSAQSSVRSSTAPNNARVKALEAAARKKEADEKAAQKKVEQKKELERKRAAKAEEDRRAEEERKAAEQQRVQEAKMAAQQKQAAEAKRREQQRLEQQQRQQEEAQKAKEAHDLAEAIKRERALQQQQPPHPRGDVGGTLRQLAKNTVPDPSANRPPIQPNPAKPAKRVWIPDDEEPVHHAPQQPQRPGLQRGPPSYQQNDAKRRRTNEEEKPDERHSVMAPPMRPSNIRKVCWFLLENEEQSTNVRQESGLSRLPHGYTNAPPPTHHPASMFKTAVTAQHQLHHGPKPGMPTHPSQLVQVSNARIPFAENSNPPGTAQHYGQGQMHPGYENMQPGAHQNKFKTPSRPAQAPKSAKSSPMYPNGDNIQLPDIATDSEDEDSEDEDNTGFRAPSWVASPALRDLLTQQQLVDPESVFGPIGELKMEEVFRNGKNQDRLKKLRDRSSSAAWVLNGDAVTSAEKRKDMQLRERVAREGGWRYEPDT